MQIPFGKINVGLLLGMTLAFGQDIQPPAEPIPPVSPSPQQTQSPSDSQTNSGGTSAALDYLITRKPKDGSPGKQALDAGKRVEAKAIAEDAVGIPRQEDYGMRTRFERYLGTPEVPQEEIGEYFSEMKEISNLLRDNQVFAAWKALHLLGENTAIDGGISRELANRVEAIWNTSKANAGLNQQNAQLKKDVKTANANADLMSDRITEKEIEYQRRLRQKRSPSAPSPLPDGGVPSAPQQSAAETAQAAMIGIEGKLQLTEEYLRSLELKAKIKLNELKQEKLLEQAKTDFASYITTLFNSGRLYHVVLAADFYRKLFQEGDYPTEMAEQVNASLEINRDVVNAIEVFRYKAERGQIAGANDSLQRAFMTSELNPAVLGLDRSLKEKVADFNAKLDLMRNLIEARDFGALEELLTEIKGTTRDFDTTKPMAIVNAVKLESKMRLGKAKLAAQRGDQQKALEEFQAAAEAWPGNPDLEDKAVSFFDTQDVKTQTIVEFDRMIEDQNYRGIYEKQLAYAPALKDDAQRLEAFKAALEAIKSAEMASEKANLLAINGDHFGAWETIEAAIKKLPDDKKLNKFLAELSGRSAEFVAAINKARDAESLNDVGYSLVWYVNAQRLYPGSQIANEGIQRLSKKLLNEKS